MSALAWELAGSIAPAESQTRRKSKAWRNFWSRLVETRQQKADGVVRAHLVSMTDERLAQLGFGKEDIIALRAGELRPPQPAKRG